MEELDKLKRDWKRRDHGFPDVSEQEIYKMLHRKSSSIVKWILIISVLEVLLWTGVGLCYSLDEYDKSPGGQRIVLLYHVLNFVNYAVIVIFIYLFYRNYRRISTTVSTQTLMQSILRTRKTVQYYVYYNLAMISVGFVVSFLLALLYSPEVSALRDKLSGEIMYRVLVIGVLLLAMAIAVGVFWLFYRLLYGILLRRLYENYKELQKIEI